VNTDTQKRTGLDVGQVVGAIEKHSGSDVVDAEAAHRAMTESGGGPHVIVVNVDGAALPEAAPNQQAMDVGTYAAMTGIASAFGIPELSPRPQIQVSRTPPPSPPHTERIYQGPVSLPEYKERKDRVRGLLILLLVSTLAVAIPAALILLGG
jgi:hypothetical protein